MVTRHVGRDAEKFTLHATRIAKGFVVSFWTLLIELPLYNKEIFDLTGV